MAMITLSETADAAGAALQHRVGRTLRQEADAHAVWAQIENYVQLRVRMAREDAFLAAGRPDLIAYAPPACVLP